MLLALCSASPSPSGDIATSGGHERRLRGQLRLRQSLDRLTSARVVDATGIPLAKMAQSSYNTTNASGISSKCSKAWPLTLALALNSATLPIGVRIPRWEYPVELGTDRESA